MLLQGQHAAPEMGEQLFAFRRFDEIGHECLAVAEKRQGKGKIPMFAQRKLSSYTKAAWNFKTCRFFRGRGRCPGMWLVWSVRPDMVCAVQQKTQEQHGQDKQDTQDAEAVTRPGEKTFGL